mgnify:CR=1 FL=1
MKKSAILLFALTIPILSTSCETASEKGGPSGPTDTVQYSVSEITESQLAQLDDAQTYKEIIEILGSPGVLYDASFLATWSTQDCQLRALFIANRPISTMTYCPEGGEGPWASVLEKLKSYRDYRTTLQLPNQTAVGQAYSWQDKQGSKLRIAFFDEKPIWMVAESASAELRAFFTSLFDVDMSRGKTNIAAKVAKDFSFIEAPSSQKDLESILRSEASKAISLGQAPYVLFTADWCPPCMALRENLDDPLMREAFKNTYIIEIDTVRIDPKDETVVEKKFGLKGVPMLYELNADGGPTGRKISGSAWGADIPANMAPPLKAFFGD